MKQSEQTERVEIMAKRHFLRYEFQMSGRLKAASENVRTKTTDTKTEQSTQRTSEQKYDRVFLFRLSE